MCCISPRPRANTADFGSDLIQQTSDQPWPIRNYLINNNLINLLNFIFELSIEARLPSLYWLEKKQDISSSLLAESYWPSYVSIGRVALYRPSLSLI